MPTHAERRAIKRTFSNLASTYIELFTEVCGTNPDTDMYPHAVVNRIIGTSPIEKGLALQNLQTAVEELEAVKRRRTTPEKG